MKLAAEEEDASIKSIAVRALANTGGRECAARFFKILADDERTNNRAEAAKFFARAGTIDDIAALAALHDRERVYYIKQRIEQAIRAIGEREPR